MFVLSVLSCGVPGRIFPEKPSLPTMTTSGCISPEPTQKDIDRALTFAGQAIDPVEWKRNHSVAENRVAVTWSNVSQSAIIYLEALVFPCGYGDADLNDYFSAENWKIIFSNYDGYQLLEDCTTEDGLRRYQFEAANQGLDYDIRYWVKADTDTRVITMMVVFPVGSETQLDDVSSRLFPDLVSCP